MRQADAPMHENGGSSASAAELEIRARIARHGRIAFAEFMQLALYHPAGGYYSRGGAVGADGDYFTSPSAHPAFGALIAAQLRRMWEILGRPAVFHAVEMGAGSGRLAADVSARAAGLGPDFAAALRYIAIDRSRPVSRGKAPPFHRIAAAGAPLGRVAGCFISNELVDAFPVHRFVTRDGKPREIYVTERRGELVEEPAEPSTPALAQRLDRLPHRLPDGRRGEVNLEIGPWMAEVSEALERGFVVTIDYGRLERELYSETRPRGTLQTYYRHAPGSSPYRRVGCQDITSHADFSEILHQGRRAGLNAVAFASQADYLRMLGIERWIQALRTAPIRQTERHANLMAMRQLVDPSGLGGFNVLVQEKGTGVDDLSSLAPAPGAASPPLLTEEHVPLMEGRYPHAAWELG